jgi:hypothetical protein
MTPTSVVRGDLAVSVEEFNLEAAEAGFVAARVLPEFDVDLVSAQYAVIPIEQLLADSDDTRAPGSSYNRGRGKFKMDTYACIEHGVEEPVDDREAKMYARYFDAETVAARRARGKILRNYERRVQAAVQSTATFTGALTAALATKWSVEATATPIDDLDTYKLQVRTNCGFLPNKLILTYAAFLAVRKTAQIVDKIKYAGIDDPKNVTPKMLAGVFDLKEVVVAGAIANTANESQAASISSIWNDAYATLAYVDDSDDIRSITLGRTFHFTSDGSSMGGAVETYRDETARSNVVRVRMDTHEKIMRPQAGLLITNVL